MKIRISYKVKNGSEKRIELTPEEYFDPLDENENYEDEGVAKFNHAEEYLKIPKSELEWTEIEITETTIGHNIRTEYFDEGKSQMIQRKDVDGHELIILISQLNDSDTNIIRIHKNVGENWEAEFNVISTLKNGYETERRIY